MWFDCCGLFGFVCYACWIIVLLCSLVWYWVDFVLNYLVVSVELVDCCDLVLGFWLCVFCCCVVYVGFCCRCWFFYMWLKLRLFDYFDLVAVCGCLSFVWLVICLFWVLGCVCLIDWFYCLTCWDYCCNSVAFFFMFFRLLFLIVA